MTDNRDMKETHGTTLVVTVAGGGREPYPVHAPSPEEIEAGRSAKGGWTRKTLAGWGVSWPPPHGWKRCLEERFRRERAEESQGMLALRAADGSLRYFADPMVTAQVGGEAWSTDPRAAKRFTESDRFRFSVVFGEIAGAEWLAAGFLGDTKG